MIFQGISVSWAAAGAAFALAVLIALHFLREKLPGRVIPGTMLWREVSARVRRNFLREKLTRLPDMLPILLAVCSVLAALTEPVYDPQPQARRTVLVAAPGTVETTARWYEKSEPLRTAVLFSAGSGALLADFGGSSAKMTESDTDKTYADTLAVAACASHFAGPDGRVIWVGPQVPAWLPPRSGFIRCGETSDARMDPPLKVMLQNTVQTVRRNAADLPGVILTDNETDADVVWHPTSAGGDFDGFYRHLIHSGLYSESDGRQEIADVAEVKALPVPASRRLSGWLFALALAGALADWWLWRKQRIV
ncbi:MAG: hypothetical protein MR051_05785 [Lentisphaeria bacterium]|nr:hypothetical protein [Lentisphaeria bacterium]